MYQMLIEQVDKAVDKVAKTNMAFYYFVWYT